MRVNPVPEAHKGAIPFLAVFGGAQCKGRHAFYKKAFGAKEALCIEHQGQAGHAELAIGAARILLCHSFPEHGTLSPKTIG
jgi:PhnB protein